MTEKLQQELRRIGAVSNDGEARGPMLHAADYIDWLEAQMKPLADILCMADQMVARGTHRIRLDDDFPNTCGLVLPMNDPDDGECLVVASLDLEDSGYGPMLWALAIKLLKARAEMEAR